MNKEGFVIASRLITAVSWCLLGALLIWQGVFEMTTLRDSNYNGAVAWARGYLPWLVLGALVLLSAIVIWFEIQKLRAALLICCWILVAYGLGYLLLGPEGTVLHTRVAPALVVALSLWTILNVNRLLAVRPDTT